ncbi:MAG: IgGFc-binding protein [Paludibacteraceae bacterium]|nr:IgGFc-binding protein [Paludibacteraceae bacterium]
MLVTIACQQAMAQASTEGKTFWVALGLANAPGGDISAFNPFIAISAKKACTVQLSAPAGNWVDQPRQIQADSWTIIDDIPDNVWYNTNWNANSANEQTNPYGILVQASEDVSVYAAMRMEYSYDASNILPVTAIQSEYMLQDYPTFNSEGDAHSVFVICATEDNTTVDINLSTPSIGGRAANTPYNITLAHKGQTYQVISTNTKSFSGTTVKARNGKKIAVFSGADFTQVPGGKSARDCLYEQAMPVDYWGNEFVVTRSVERDANRVRITALEDATDIRIDNRHVTFLNAGETYEFEISEDLAPTIKEIHTKAGRDIPDIYNGIAHYIQTSCPCAVFSYDVSSEYRFSETTKIGDPSMVWIAPLQQRINKITFGACGTSGTSGHTNRHYVDIVCLTSDIATFHLESDQRANIPVTFTPVPGNTKYSYAQLFLVDTDQPNPDKVYTMSSKTGFVAHVYGSGNNESYAYSCGSAAVKRAINLDGMTFTDGLRGENRFCINTLLEFDAQVGTDIIDKVDWDFGDGITEYNGAPQTIHEYETKGWYDVIANVYAHKDCPETVYPAEAVHFSFYVDKAEIIKHETSKCIPWDDPLTTDTITDTVRYNCDSIVITSTFVRRESKPTDIEITAKDSFLLNGEWIYETADRSYTYMNSQNCDSVVNYHINIVYCLDLEVPTEVDPECDGQTSILIDFFFHKGEIDRAVFVTNLHGEQREFEMTVSSDYTYFLLNVSEFEPGILNGHIEVHDPICMQTLSFPISIFVRLPNSIMHQKYDNVVGVTLAAIQQYDIRGYQWLIDGELKPEQSQSIYYQNAGFEPNQYIEVLVLMPNGQWLRSCRLNLTGESQMDNPFRDDESARKVMHDGNMYIMRDGDLYNTLGEKVD